MNRNLGLSNTKLLVRVNVVLLLGSMLLFTSGCAQKPTLTGLNPTSGPPGTVVEVLGSGLTFSGVRWDANTPQESSVPTSFLGAGFFTVPLNASQGSHPVKLYGAGQYSDNSIDFNVTAGVVRPKPRIDDVTVSFFTLSEGKASFLLMVHGANIDVGTQIQVNGTTQNSFFSRLLRNPNLQATNAATLGYPIFHYATIWTILSDQVPGSTISISVKNLDGSTSDTVNYRIAANMAELDSDGDGLPDTWEKNGYDANNDGTVDVDLPGLGADPLHKDLFVEVDWMKSFVPNNAIWAIIENVFANAPVLNPDGTQGIVIHIDHGQQGAGGGGGTVIADATRIRYDNEKPEKGVTYANFYTLKANNFNADRLEIYRYCIFALENGYENYDSSGRVEDIWSNDFYISLDGWGATGQLADIQASTFMHELGHTMNLLHGGNVIDNYKPNYNSIMNYGGGADWDAADKECDRRFGTPSQSSGIDTDCNLSNTHRIYTYSQGMRASLNENSLNEGAGVCDNIPIDWDRDGNSTETGVAMDINCDNVRSVLQDYADWANTRIDFRSSGSNWGNN